MRREHPRHLTAHGLHEGKNHLLLLVVRDVLLRVLGLEELEDILHLLAEANVEPGQVCVHRRHLGEHHLALRPEELLRYGEGLLEEKRVELRECEQVLPLTLEGLFHVGRSHGKAQPRGNLRDIQAQGLLKIRKILLIQPLQCAFLLHDEILV